MLISNVVLMLIVICHDAVICQVTVPHVSSLHHDSNDDFDFDEQDNIIYRNFWHLNKWQFQHLNKKTRRERERRIYICLHRVFNTQHRNSPAAAHLPHVSSPHHDDFDFDEQDMLPKFKHHCNLYTCTSDGLDTVSV